MNIFKVLNNSFSKTLLRSYSQIPIINFNPINFYNIEIPRLEDNEIINESNDIQIELKGRNSKRPKRVKVSYK